MANKDEFNDPKKPNVKALSAYMLKGKPVAKGQVMSKKDFTNKADWQNLCNMEPARCEETADAVGAPKAEKPADDKKSGKGSKAPGGAPG